MSGTVYQYVIIYLFDWVYRPPAKKRKIDDNEGLTFTSLNLQAGKQLKSSESYSRLTQNELLETVHVTSKCINN